jgi:hypothetical protein
MLPNWTQRSRQVNLTFGSEEKLNAHSERQVYLTFGSEGLTTESPIPWVFQEQSPFAREGIRTCTNGKTLNM